MHRDLEADAHRVAETLRLFLSLGVRKVALSRFSPAGYSLAFARELMPSRDDVGRALADAAAVARAESPRAPVQLFSTMPIPPCAVKLARFPEESSSTTAPSARRGRSSRWVRRGELRHCALDRDPIAGARDVLDPTLDVAALFAAGDPHRYRAVLARVVTPVASTPRRARAAAAPPRSG